MKANAADNKIIEKMRILVDEINALPKEKRGDMVNELEDAIKNVVTRNGDAVAGFVYETRNLTQFSFMNGNRIINEDSAKVRKLAKSLALYGNVVPGIVNEKNELADGQRRITAYRKYGLNKPYRYIRSKYADIALVGDMNRNAENWGHRDWLHKYVTLKNPHYIEYAGLAKDYEQYVTARSLRSLFMNAKFESFDVITWEDGLFTIDHEKKQIVLNYLEFLKKAYAIGDKDNLFAGDRNFQKALWDIYTGTKKIDEERLLYKLRYGFSRINIKTDHKNYKRIVGLLYNSRLAGDKHAVIIQEEAVA